MAPSLSKKEALSKIENFCGYQERCHQEIITKLKSYGLEADEIDEIVVRLIETNFLNEERYARSFARGKHNIKKWGRRKIANHLKHRGISTNLIAIAMNEIDSDAYMQTFESMAQQCWKSFSDKKPFVRRSKFCEFLIRKGYENDMVYEKYDELERMSPEL